MSHWNVVLSSLAFASAVVAPVFPDPGDLGEEVAAPPEGVVCSEDLAVTTLPVV